MIGANGWVGILDRTPIEYLKLFWVMMEHRYFRIGIGSWNSSSSDINQHL